MIYKFFGTLAGRLVLIALVAAVLLFGIRQCESARNAGQQARVSENQAEAVSDSAADAVGTVGAVSGRSSDTDDLTRSNEDAIRNAPGADAPVDERATGAGIDSLCKRAAYRGSEQCLQRAAAAGVAGAGAGSTPAER